MSEKKSKIVIPFLNEEQMNGKIGLFAKVTLFPKDELEFHEHHGETETYYILSGEGRYNDNGKTCVAKSGDLFFCKDGESHGIACVGEESLEFIALIINS